jgi:hypothetical protein
MARVRIPAGAAALAQGVVQGQQVEQQLQPRLGRAAGVAAVGQDDGVQQRVEPLEALGHQPVADLAGQGAAGDGDDHGPFQLAVGTSEALSNWRAPRAMSSAMAEISASEASGDRARAAQARWKVRRSRRSPLHEKAFQVPNTRRQSCSSRRARRAEPGPAASRCGSQSKPCRAVANWRSGWAGRTDRRSRPAAGRRRPGPSSLPAAGGRARHRWGADRGDGRPGRRDAGRLIAARCGGEPNHSRSRLLLIDAPERLEEHALVRPRPRALGPPARAEDLRAEPVAGAPSMPLDQPPFRARMLAA